MISKENKIEIKTKILLEIEETKNKINQLKEFTKPIEPDCAIGRISRMDAINNKSVNDLALRKQKEKLVKLNFALSKIEEEYFGMCSNCETPIQIGRIMLMPESNYCVRCASRR